VSIVSAQAGTSLRSRSMGVCSELLVRRRPPGICLGR
jgi:hypothetical protein